VPQLTGPNGKPKRWQGVGPMTFLERDGQDKLIFKPGQDGRMEMILPYPFFIGQRIGASQNGKLISIGLGVSLVLMLATLILWPITWFVRWHYGRKLELTSKELLLRILTRVVFALDLIFIIAFAGLVSYGLTHLEVFSDRGTMWFRLVQIIGVLGALGTLVVLANAIIMWTRKRSFWMKLQGFVMLLACLGVLWFTFAGNLLSFTSHY